MAVKRILTFGETTLERVSKKVDKIDEETTALISDMKVTLMASPGIGLAASQIGVLKKVIYINFKDDETEFIIINPKIKAKSGSIREAEGCLSYPNYEGIVDRPKKVTVTGIDEKGRALVLEGEGLLARALCHEIDHLDGVLYTERARKVYKLED
jgi:peptide deformylase